MKKTRQFLPLLKHMLGLYCYGPIPLILWFLACGLVLYFSAIFSPEFLDLTLWRGTWVAVGKSEINVQLVMSFALGLFLLIVSTPLPFQILAGPTSLEFLFTRAVDRAVWLRTERIAVILLAVVPLMINLVLYSLRLMPGETTPGEWLRFRLGPEIFAAWLVWAALVIIFLVAGYFTVVFTLWQRAGWHVTDSKWRPWLGGVMVNAPAFSIIPLLLFCMATGINIYQECFLIFARHPVCLTLALIALILIVQPLSERNIKKLEFEFF